MLENGPNISFAISWLSYKAKYKYIIIAKWILHTAL